MIHILLMLPLVIALYVLMRVAGFLFFAAVFWTYMTIVNVFNSWWRKP